MAYLSDDEQQAQDAAGKPQSNFDISAPVSQSASQSSGDPGQSQGGATSSQASSDNATGYEQSFSGGGDSGGANPTKVGGSTNSAGLGSSTPGGGFVNFSAYENANPSTAEKISSAGNSLVGSETGVLNAGTSADPNSGFSSATAGAPTDANSLRSEFMDPNANNWASNEKNLSGWLNESYTPPAASYTPSAQWNTQAPELSQTGVLGGQNKPSVVDALAAPNIAAGNYTGGERALDQSIIGGDQAAQNAIAQNATNFGNFQTGAAAKVAGLQGDFAQNQALADSIKTNAANALAGLNSQTQSDIQSQQGSRDTFIKQEEANLDAAHPAYASQINKWLESSGLGPQGVSPQDAMIADRIAQVKGQPLPYADPNNPNGSTQAQSAAQLSQNASEYGLTPAEMQGLGIALPAGTSVTPAPTTETAQQKTAANVIANINGGAATQSTGGSALTPGWNIGVSASDPNQGPPGSESWTPEQQAAWEKALNPSGYQPPAGTQWSFL